ncbi:hypothetical protein P618_200793 [Holospora obtusa F1]|uniref:Integrase catalytic domain-containing protein n=1 Tax=Holospora obtusa F1 TaxID=1399147 RepID=W6TTC6_HOLOB|nr:hypothetical protein P618_200793 [Holospora obtusa F1]
MAVNHHKHAFTHIFQRVCNKNNSEHRKINGQIERMNKTLKEAPVNNFDYASHDQLKQHLHAYLMAYFTKKLQAIKGKTPWQLILNQWIIYPQYFTINPNQLLIGTKY